MNPHEAARSALANALIDTGWTEVVLTRAVDETRLGADPLEATVKAPLDLHATGGRGWSFVTPNAAVAGQVGVLVDELRTALGSDARAIRWLIFATLDIAGGLTPILALASGNAHEVRRALTQMRTSTTPLDGPDQRSDESPSVERDA